MRPHQRDSQRPNSDPCRSGINAALLLSIRRVLTIDARLTESFQPSSARQADHSPSHGASGGTRATLELILIITTILLLIERQNSGVTGTGKRRDYDQFHLLLTNQKGFAYRCHGLFTVPVQRLGWFWYLAVAESSTYRESGEWSCVYKRTVHHLFRKAGVHFDGWLKLDYPPGTQRYFVVTRSFWERNLRGGWLIAWGRSGPDIYQS